MSHTGQTYVCPSCCLLRFAAAVDLAMKLEGHPQKAAILEALERRRLGRVDAFFENFITELAVTGARMPTCSKHPNGSHSSPDSDYSSTHQF